MSLVSLISADEAPITTRQFFGSEPGPLVATFAHVPEMLMVSMPFIQTVLGPSSIDFRTKEIVILRVSALKECIYCVNTHSYVARKAKLTKNEVLALRSSKVNFFATEKENILVQWTDDVVKSSYKRNAEILSTLKTHYDEAEIVELTMLIGATVMLNIYATTLDLPVSTAHQEFLQNEDLVY
jgi:AhpD family alkylhydroperoxidase